MNKESFLDTIKQQYTDDLREAYIECIHGSESRVDLRDLNKRIQKLMSHARVEGLSAMEFESLARATLPDVADQIEFQPMRKAA